MVKAGSGEVPKFPVPQCGQEYEVILGESLFGPNSNNLTNYSLRYDCIPRSVNTNLAGEMNFESGSGARVTHSSDDGSHTTEFRGRQQKCKDEEFILIFRTGKFYLEKLDYKITNLKKTSKGGPQKLLGKGVDPLKNKHIGARVSPFTANAPSASFNNSLPEDVFKNNQRSGKRGQTKVLNHHKSLRPNTKKKITKRNQSKRQFSNPAMNTMNRNHQSHHHPKPAQIRPRKPNLPNSSTNNGGGAHQSSNITSRPSSRGVAPGAPTQNHLPSSSSSSRPSQHHHEQKQHHQRPSSLSSTPSSSSSSSSSSHQHHHHHHAPGNSDKLILGLDGKPIELIEYDEDDEDDELDPFASDSEDE